jgi:hypothetical protein
MSEPWWWPQEINADYLDRLREDYPEKTSGWSDDTVIEYFGGGWDQFADTWDNLRDARDQYEKLARAFLDLVSETGKTPADYLSPKEPRDEGDPK